MEDKLELRIEECDSLGLHPLHEPLPDMHHTDVEFTESDKAFGHAIAYFLGTLFADVDGEESRYWYHQRTSVDEWSRVVRALRIHGLAIVDQAPKPNIATHRQLADEAKSRLLENNELHLRILNLEHKQYISLALIEELRHHASDIAQVVAWLHAHAPDRFDARLSMGQLITGILSEWLSMRQSHTGMYEVLGRSIFARLAFVLTGTCRSKRRMET